MKPGIHIREAKIEDAPGIAAVHVQSWQTTYVNIFPEEFLKRLNASMREKWWVRVLSHEEGEQGVFVAETNPSRIVGFASCGEERVLRRQDYTGELFAIYILQEYQRSGIGKKLWNACVRWLVARGHDSMLAWVHPMNRPACKFYESLGGEIVSRKKERVAGKTHDVVAYGWKNLRKKSL